MWKWMIKLTFLSQTIKESVNALAKVVRNLGDGRYRLVWDEEHSILRNH